MSQINLQHPRQLATRFRRGRDFKMVKLKWNARQLDCDRQIESKAPAPLPLPCSSPTSYFRHLRSIVCTYYPPETGGSLATRNPKPWRRFNFEWGRRDLKLNQRAAMLDDKRGCYFNPPEAPGAHVEPEAEPNERHSRRGKMKRSKNLIYFDWHIPVSLPRKMVSPLLNLTNKS